MRQTLSVFALALLAACATPGTSTDTGSNDTSGPQTVYPGAGTTSSSIVPGSQADLEQNVGHRVFFGYNQFTLSPEAQSVLRAQAAWLQSHPTAKIRVEGHCDERGTREYNLALGARRAEAVRTFLIGSGVAGSRITTVSYGKERPLATGSDDRSWAMNRNGTTIVEGGPGA